MANPPEKLASIHEVSTPPEESYDDFDEEEIAPSSSCGCLWGFYFRALRGRSNIGTQRYLLQQQGGDQVKENWLVENAKKVREFSEVLAGPKWKNFIRSFSTIYKKRRVQFQYDLQSYALNFDDGGFDREIEGNSYLHFSNAGYASCPGMNNAKF
ncbi:hypothetical protein PRUPE_1G486100 [Prunus persica]|uniref:Uncharacterized protein n=1 Tax=Prunus persica TaxID=3760 RepID=M5XFG2_PRUPE|nr:uncharacterized protein LOC18790282 [Prunus persica]ONI34533.1 hypothetical protein PRUPE_1G486100 [Prunus persica]